VAGISGATVRFLEIDGLMAVVSEYSGDAVPVTRANALCHAAVVRSVFTETTPLPFRFGTLASERQLKSYVSARKPKLEAKLTSVRDCVEMNVKLIWELSEKGEGGEDDIKHHGIGTAFLAEKRRALIGDERRVAQANEAAEWLRACVSGLVKDEQITVRPAERLFFTAAHLVERSKIRQYRERSAEVRTARPDFRFLSSGPWPPYSFANVELEFQSQFGVS
jgi:hypothetical protein